MGLQSQLIQQSMSVKKITGYSIFLKELLGKGSYGEVYMGEQDNTKVKCAVKMIKKKNIDEDQYLKNALFKQIQILRSIKSENVVGFLDVMQSSTNYYIIQELCDKDLEKQIQDNGGTISQDKSIKYLTEICNGFLALVKQGIIHRDLKPANVMLSKGTVKIGDFGFAKKNITKKMKNQSSVGTPLYMSIQILKGEPYTSKCDIWALGFIFYEMLHGKTPWTANTQFELVRNIEHKPLTLKEGLHADTKDFLEKCLKPKQADRISWDQIFIHPIFKGYFNKYTEHTKQLENKMKRIMADIRFMINSQNIDLKKLFERFGFSQNQQLAFPKFEKLIKTVNPNITNEEVSYMFQKLDVNCNGAISIIQLQEEMKKNNISLQSIFSFLPKIQKKFPFLIQTQSVTESEPPLSKQLEEKIRKCFNRLYKTLTAKNISLYKTFNVFDSDHSGQLNIEQFAKIMSRLDTTITQDQIQLVFDYIDEDKSKSIQFDEFNNTYCKVNKIPPTLELPPEYFQEKKKYDSPYYSQKKGSEGFMDKFKKAFHKGSF